MATITGELKKAVTFNQLLQVDGVSAVNLTASINSSNPENLTMNRGIMSPALYWAHRDELCALQFAFEDAVREEQQAMTAGSEE